MDINFLNIIDDYERLVKTQVKIPLDNSVIIDFTFKKNHLPHLLGLNKLVDIPILLDYSNKKKSAIEIYNGIRFGDIDTNQFKESNYYQEIYENKLKYFNSDRIISLIKSTEIIKFDSNKIRNFKTKLDKVDYLFFELIGETDTGYAHFGIAFTNEDRINQPNTFFVRNNDDYIDGQTFVYANSLYIKDKNGNITFKIHWENVRKSLFKNKHYKELNKLSEKYGYKIETLCKKEILEIKKVVTQENEAEVSEVERHFRLLRLDEVKEVYIPYIPEAGMWNNNQKQYLVDRTDKFNKDILPKEIKRILNEFHD